MSRETYRQIAAETVEILDLGGYATASGVWVDVQTALTQSVAGTVEVTDIPPTSISASDGTTAVTLADQDTLSGAAWLADQGHDRIAVLNFASARSPGGGFLRGANAQEESLCRSTTLYAALAKQQSFYDRNKAWPNPVYADALLYTPDVLIIRDAYGHLQQDPLGIAVLTAPAPNANAVAERPDGANMGQKVERALAHRIDMILATAARHGHRALVLGAWGCGVFGNPANRVAQLFQDALSGPYAAAFDALHFAVLSGGRDDNLQSFAQVFGPPVSQK